MQSGIERESGPDDQLMRHKLISSAPLLEALLDSVEDGIIVHDHSGRLAYANAAAAQIAGVAAPQMLLSFSLSDVLRGFVITNESGHSVPIDQLPGQQVFRDGRSHQARLRFRTGHTDERRWFVVKASPVFDDQGGVRAAISIFRDVTEPHRAEEEHGLLASLVASSSDSIIALTLDGVVASWNVGAERLYGYTAAEAVGRYAWSFAPPERQQESMEIFKRVARGERLEQVETVRVTKTGKRIDVSLTLSPILNAAGTAIGVSAIVRDVTARKRAEAELRARVLQQAAVAELGQRALVGSDLTALFDEAARLITRGLDVEYVMVLECPRDGDSLVLRAGAGWQVGQVGRATLEMGMASQAGYTLLTNAPVVVDDLATETRFGESGLLQEHRVVSGITVLIRGQSRAFGVLGAHTARRRRFQDDDVHFLQAVANVLAAAIDRATADDLLREKEVQYRSIFEATSDAVHIFDLDGNQVEVNPAACRMLGYSRDELVGLDPSGWIHPESLGLFRHFVETVRGGDHCQFRAMGVRREGTTYHCEVHGSPVIFMGRPHLMAVVRDVTEHVHAYELLEERVRERTRELSTLLEVSSTVASLLELGPLLDVILEQLRSIVDHSGAVIMTFDGQDLTILEHRMPEWPARALVGMRVPVTQARGIWRTLRRRQPVIIPDTADQSAVAREFAAVVHPDRAGGPPATSIRSGLVLPLALSDRTIGLLGLVHHERRYFTPHHADLALAIATQAAVAMENARLYGQAQALAVMEERQRLARELHDSVTQVLYGISLNARSARAWLDRDPQKAVEPLEDCLKLAGAGLTEMRALILELRPESLETEGLVAALAKQVDAIQIRHGVKVRLDLNDEPHLSLSGKETLYRIAQEALHNTAKHARANQVTVWLRGDHERVVLEVTDDGIGFDPRAEFPGHFGLQSMRERTLRQGGKLEIDSAPGRGTRVRAWIPSG